MATGEAAELWPGSLGTFSPLPGEFFRGRQIFKNTTTGWGLRVRPLHCPSRLGWEELVEELVLRQKMDINKRDGFGNTTLMLAV